MATKEYTYEDLNAHKTRDDLWVTIHQKVYNVTSFLDEHPGGDEVLIEEAGRDATEAFEDVGHSDEAREMLVKMLIGELKAGENGNVKRAATSAAGQVKSGSSPLRFLPVVAVIVAWVIYRTFYA